MFTARNRAAQRETAAGTHLPYLAQIDDHTVLTREGHLLHVIALAGHGGSVDAARVEVADALVRVLIQRRSRQGVAFEALAGSPQVAAYIRAARSHELGGAGQG